MPNLRKAGLLKEALLNHEAAHATAAELKRKSCLSD
jgi:hypothetical protein